MTKVCRGCAGTGVGQHVSPRTIAVLEHISYTWGLVDHANPRRMERQLVVGRPERSPLIRRRTVTVAPLAPILQLAGRLLADGFSYDEESAAVPLNPEWTCSWCHGTGTPQLSVGTLSAIGALVDRIAADLDEFRVRREEGRYP